MSINVRKLTVLAMLTAISALLIMLVQIPIFPAAPFLKYDPADIAILVAAFAFGPLAGLTVTVIASAIQAFLLGGDGIYGFLMHVIASGVLAVVAGFIYRLLHTRAGGAVALLCGTVAMALTMMVANHYITPFYTGAPVEAVDQLLLPVILPFNLIKAGANSLITFLIYKTISRYVVHSEPHKAAKGSESCG